MRLYRAKVVDNNDPDFIGRVRVHVFEMYDEVDIENLPWAEVIGSNQFGLLAGIGVSSILRPDTWVWVIFENNDPNCPIVLGTIAGINSEKGEFYPKEERSKESDIHRLARNSQLNNKYHGSKPTIHKQINDNLTEIDAQDELSGALVKFKQSKSTDDLAEYPNVQVLETESGHTIVLDDTAGNERIRLYHSSGSFIEFSNDGRYLHKTASVTNHIQGNLEEIIDNAVKRYVEGNIDEIIKGYVKRYIEGEYKEHIAGHMTMDNDGNVTWKIGGNLSIEVSGSAEVTSGPTLKLKSGRIDFN